VDKNTIHRIKQIYELEKFQITFFQSQLSATENKFYQRAFRKLVHTEKKHADFFAHLLAKADINIPKIGGTVAEIAGSIVGESMEFTGPENACRLGVALENRTLAAYHELINSLDSDSELYSRLLDFLLEEEFHALWLKDYAKRLEYDEHHKNGLAGHDLEDHPSVNVNMRFI
jgi:bacterioferritin